MRDCTAVCGCAGTVCRNGPSNTTYGSADFLSENADRAPPGGERPLMTREERSAMNTLGTTMAVMPVATVMATMAIVTIMTIVMICGSWV